MRPKGVLTLPALQHGEEPWVLHTLVQRIVDHSGIVCSCLFCEAFGESNIGVDTLFLYQGFCNDFDEQNFITHVQAVYDGAPVPDPSAITNEEAGEVVWQGILDKKNFILTHQGTFSTGAAMGEKVDCGYVSTIDLSGQ